MKYFLTFYILLIFISLNTFADNSDTTKIISFKFDKFSDPDTIPIDTFLNNFQIFNYSYFETKSISTLGNNGSPFISNDITLVSKNKYPFFLNSFSSYFINSENNIFFNTKSPFTELFYAFGSKKDQSLKISHTQNINNKLNIGLNYRLAAAQGHFKKQKTRNHALSLFSSYISDRYVLGLNFLYNRNNNVINGGIASDSLFENTDEPTETIEVILNDAVTTSVAKSISLNQKFCFYKKNNQTDSVKLKYLFSIGHLSELSVFSRSYLDKKNDFYNNWLIDNVSTNDTTYLKRLDNYIFLGFNPEIINGLLLKFNAGIFNRLEKYGFYLFDTLNSSLAVKSGLSASGGKFYFTLLSEIYVNGYYNKDMSNELKIKKYLSQKADSSSIDFNVSFSNKRPDYYFEKYYCNNFLWDTLFKSQQEFNLRLAYSNQKRKIQLGVFFKNLSNYLYFDTLASPKQTNDDFYVYSAFAKADLKFGQFHLNNIVTYQYSSSKVVSLPDIILYHSVYYKFNFFKSKLPTNIGFDLYYNSYYKGYAYMPATSVFYLQNEKKFGGHPYIDFFITAQRKKARLLLKLEHLSALVSKRNYYTVLHNPMNGFSIKFGVSWRFND